MATLGKSEPLSNTKLTLSLANNRAIAKMDKLTWNRHKMGWFMPFSLSSTVFRDRGEMVSSAPDVVGKCEHTSIPVWLLSTWFCTVFLISTTTPSLLSSSVHYLSPSFLVWVPAVSPYFYQLVPIFHYASNLPDSQSWSYNFLQSLLP